MRGTKHVGVAVLLLVVVSACGWTQARYDAGRTANNPIEQKIGLGSVASLEPSWTATADGYFGEPLVRGGRAVVQDGETVRVLDAATGTPRWSAPPVPDSPGIVNLRTGIATARTADARDLVVAGDHYFNSPLYPDTMGGHLTAYDAATGATQWSQAIQPISAPVVVGQTLFVNALEGDRRTLTFIGVIALDVTTGAVKFRAPIADIGPSLAVSGSSLVTATSNGFSIVPVDGCGAASCGALWSGVGTARFGTTVAVADGQIFAASDSGLEAYPATGCGAVACAPAWRGAGAFGALAIAGGRVFATGEINAATPATMSVFATTGCGAATCAPVWTSAESKELQPPSVANGLVYAGAHDGSVLAWPASGCGAPTCTAVWSVEVDDAVIATTIADGRVYVSSSTLHTYALPE